MTELHKGKRVDRCYFCNTKLRGRFPNFLSFMEKSGMIISVYCHASCYKTKFMEIH